jgi:hypothetical protein
LLVIDFTATCGLSGEKLCNYAYDKGSYVMTGIFDEKQLLGEMHNPHPEDFSNTENFRIEMPSDYNVLRDIEFRYCWGATSLIDSSFIFDITWATIIIPREKIEEVLNSEE